MKKMKTKTQHTPESRLYVAHRYTVSRRSNYKTGWTVLGICFKPGTFLEKAIPCNWNVFSTKREARIFSIGLNKDLKRRNNYLSLDAAIAKAEGAK